MKYQIVISDCEQ